MRKIVLFIIIFSLFLPTSTKAQYNFKVNPKVIVDENEDPINPQIVWTGSFYALVYETYYWMKSSNDVYLLFIDRDGQVIKGPTKISSTDYAFYPRLVWTGNEFGILYNGGLKHKTSGWKLKTYLARFDDSGKKLSENTLPGDIDMVYAGQYSKLLWTGKGFAVFYLTYADPNNDETRYPAFVTTSSSGKPDKIKQIFDYSSELFDVVWNGNKYIVFQSSVMPGLFNTVIAQIFVLDSDGSLINKKTILNFSTIKNHSEVSIVPTRTKNNYLLALGGYYSKYPLVKPKKKESDIYTGKVRIKGKKIIGFDLENATSAQKESWADPMLIKMNSKNYILCSRKNGGSFVFCEINKKGRLDPSPLLYDLPGIRNYPPRFTGTNKNEIGVVFNYNNLYFGIIEVK